MGVPINNVTRRVVYAASGTGPYNFTFEILAAGDIAVYRDDTLLTLTTNYTVTINTNGTGFVTLTATPTGATQIAIVGNRSIQRTTDFVTGGDFFANTLNDELDQQTIFNQQNAEGLQRALIAPQTDPTTIDMTLPRASVRANKTLAFDANGDPTTGEVIGDNRGNWAAGVAYNKRDIIKDTSNGNIYYANTSHTSTGSQPISTNADSAKWDLIVDNAAAGTSATAAAASASAAATSASNASTSATNAASSASTASTQASNASTSASNAATSASNAASSASAASGSASTASTQATNASNSATAAATSASNASTSATSASNSASTATTQASNAATSATNASNSASAASTSATNASNSATAASTSASNASTSATNAANSASAAATSETNAATSAAAAAAALDNFDDRYLGAKSSNPTVDNDGNALLTGALYYRTTTPVGMKVYDGAQWLEASAAQQSLLVTYEFVATSGQTTFSGTDANGATLSYVANSISVSLNGVTLRPGDDYTATNGTSVVLNVAAALNDDLMVIAFAVFNVANAVAKTGDTMTGSLLLPAGTVSAPALTTSADTNTGIFFPAADTIAFAEGGTEVARFDSSGNFGIGTSSPNFSGYGTTNLTVSGGTTIQGVLELVGTRADGNGFAAGDINFFANSNSAGNKCIASIQSLTDGVTANNRGGNLVFRTKADNGSLLERARIDSSGNLLVGRTTQVSGERFVVEGATTGWFARLRNTQASGGAQGLELTYTSQAPNGTDSPFLFCQDNTALRMSVRSNGGIANFSGNNVNLSDRREKTNFAPAGKYLSKICAIPVQTFNYIDQSEDDPGLTLGVVAQDVQEVAPELVMESNWGTEEEPKMRLSIYQTDLQYALMKCIQEQQQMIETLQAKVAALEAK